MSEPVFVLGGAQSDFARNLHREGGTLGSLAEGVLSDALGAAMIDAKDVESIHAGNAFGELFTGQAQLGALPATVIPELWGIPAMRHEAACASGSLAILSAMSEIEAGRYDVVLCYGIEQERNVPGDVAAKHMGAAAYAGHEGKDARYLWPHMFARIAEAYDARYRLRHEHLAAIAKKNFDNGRRNPLAQTRAWEFSEASFAEDDEANPTVEGRLRRQDCGQVTDGAACVVLASARFALAHAKKTGRALSDFARIAGWGHRTVGLPLEAKLRRGEESDLMFPHLRDTANDAFRRAGIADVFALQGLETHDCFTITEYVAIDHLGITAPGESWKALEAGTVARTGRLPVNPSGGLIGGGHPVGATGIRMLWDAARQVTWRAGEIQVEGARRFGTLNLGGSTTTTVVFVVERNEA